MRCTHVVESSSRPDRAATAVEYAILAALIAAVVIGTVLLVGQDAVTNFQAVDF